MPHLLSVGHIIDHAWEHYKKYFLSLMSIAAWLLLPTLIGIIALALYPSATTILSERDLTVVEMIGSGLWIVNSFIITPIIGIWIFICLTRLIHGQLEQKHLPLQTISKAGWKLFLPSIWVGILVTLIALASFLFMAPGFLLNALASTKDLSVLGNISMILILIGIALSVFFIVRWMVHYALAEYALIIDEKRGTLALTHSRILVEGRFFAVLGRLIVPNMVFLLIALIAQSVLLYLIEGLVGFLAGLNIDIQVRLIGILSTLVLSLVTILLNPLLFTANLILYHNLSETKK